MFGWPLIQSIGIRHISGLPQKCVGGCRPLLFPRTFTTNGQLGDADPKISNVAVLGGGITGLASALHLAQQLPHAQITLFERSSRLGGWLRSTQVDVGNGKVVFEQGPRTLRATRPNGWLTLDLVSVMIQG